MQLTVAFSMIHRGPEEDFASPLMLLGPLATWLLKDWLVEWFKSADMKCLRNVS